MTEQEIQQLRNVRSTLNHLSGEAKLEFNRIMEKYADNVTDLIDGIDYTLNEIES